MSEGTASIHERAWKTELAEGVGAWTWWEACEEHLTKRLRGTPVLEDVATTERKRNRSESFKESIRSSFPLAGRSIADYNSILETVRSSGSLTAVAVLVQVLRRSRCSRPTSGPSAIH